MVAVRACEISSSLVVARRILSDLPGGKLLVKRGRGGKGEGFGRCEGPEGEVCCHLSTGKGRVGGMALSLPHELNRSAARFLEGAWMDEVDVLSLVWATPYPTPGRS
jgi:Ni,Fe-hydrogenase III large subunit